jgi:hypothetical protein
MDELQESLKDEGQLLYLSKRAKHEDVSLFIHTTSLHALGDFISKHLSKIENIEDIWVINMSKPKFYPLPRDTKNLKRFSVTLKVFPGNLDEVYHNIAAASLPDGLQMAYIAYTFHLFGDNIQFSLLADDEQVLNNYIVEVINKMPGVVNSTVNQIEMTSPLVSYEEWKKYSKEHGLVPSWDEASMVNQFQK